VVSLHNAAVLTPGCFVLTSRNELLRESTPRPDIARALETRISNLEPELSAAPYAESLDHEWAAVLGMQRATNYNHWWLDCLPRAWVADRWPATRGCPLLMEPPTRSFQSESLALLGWESRVRTLDWPIERYPRLLFVTGFLLHSTQAVSPLLPAFAAHCKQRLGLNESANSGLGRRSGRGRRLYITRATARWRRVVNETELLEALSGLDVELVESNALGIEEQLRLFAEAELILAPHGAGLTNILFAPPGAGVIELLPATPRYLPQFGAMSALLGLRYGFLACGRVESGGRHPPMNEDMVVDPAAVVRAVRAALAN